MSRVASNLPTPRYNNGVGQSTKSIISRSPSNASSIHSIGDNGVKRGFNVRSTAPPTVQKETVHACPLCNAEYKDPRVLPCTHTYCLNCIRDKLINNSRLTCPKCHYQAHPFEESHLQDLPPNLILSQAWRIGARPIPSIPAPKKPMTYQSNVATSIPPTHMSQQQDRRKSLVNENNGHEITINDTNGHGIASIVNTFNQSSGTGGGGNGHRSPSVSNTQPMVSNLIKIYSEAAVSKPQRNRSVEPTDKHDELIKIFEQAASRNQQRRPSPPSNNKQQSQVHEEGFEEITWDTLVHGTTPAAPPFPDQLQSATENRHQPPEATERPSSVTSSGPTTDINHLRDMVTSIRQQSPEKTSSFHQVPIVDTQLHSRSSTPSQSHHHDDDDIHTNQTSLHQKLNTITPQRQHIRQISNADSVQSGVSDPPSRPSLISPIIDHNHQRSNVILNDTHQRQEDKVTHRVTSTPTSSSSRRSSDRFPPPPQNLETFDLTSNGGARKQRSTSSISHRSSTNGDLHEQLTSIEAKITRTERFNPDLDISPFVQRNNSSQLGSGSSTPTNRSPSVPLEHPIQYTRQQENHLSPTSSPITLTSRVDTLLTDQKHLEREIEEQIRRLKFDYEDVRKQIGRKESTIHHEVKHIAARLDNDVTDNYYRKQKIYADLAADTTTVGSELERLRSNKNNNKQQLWNNLEQIELNIRTIRQAVEQQKEPHGALTFAEGHRAIAPDTIGEITYPGNDFHQSYTSSNVRPNPSSSQPMDQTITNLTPYKYLRIDHLSTLEPEAIAITENNKKILLGICNKLYIINEYGDTLKTIQLTPSIRGIAVSKKYPTHNIAYVSHDEIVSMIDIDSGQTLDCVKETDSTGEAGSFLPLGIDTDDINGSVYVCDYRNSCVIKFDDKLEFITQWRIYNHSDHYDEARPKLISVHGQRLYMVVEHSCKPYYNQGIAYTFSLHICDINSGNIIKIIDAESLATQRLRWPCAVQALNNDKCYILDTMTSGKYFNGQWQKHWSRVLQIGQDDTHVVTELFQLDSEAATMAMTKQTMIIAANGEILFVDLAFLRQQQQQQNGVE